MTGIRLSIELTPEHFDLIAVRVADLLAARAAPTDGGFLSVEEAATYIRSSRQRVYDLCSAGLLPRYKDGSRLLLRRKDLDDHLAGLRMSGRLQRPAAPSGSARRQASARR
jgi:excisionase family DNA binding protein